MIFGYFNTEWGSLVQIQQENFSNVLKAQKKLAQGLQQVLNVQTYMLNDVVGDSARILQELTGEATPEQKMSNQMGCLRAAYDRIMDKNRQAQDILNRTQSELLTLMVRSADETVQELGSGSSAK